MPIYEKIQVLFWPLGAGQLAIKFDGTFNFLDFFSSGACYFLFYYRSRYSAEIWCTFSSTLHQPVKKLRLVLIFTSVVRITVILNLLELFPCAIWFNIPSTEAISLWMWLISRNDFYPLARSSSYSDRQYLQKVKKNQEILNRICGIIPTDVTRLH